MLGEIRNIRSEMDTMKLSYEQKLRKLKTSNHQPAQQSSRSELVIVSKIQDLIQKTLHCQRCAALNSECLSLQQQVAKYEAYIA
jgi:hypothetical protein